MQELTGGHVLAITLGFFGVVIGVNALLAYQAVSTFPGLEVDNSYVASQTWDAERAAQRALGWTLAADFDHKAAVLELRFRDASGQAADVRDLSVLVGRPTEAADDTRPAMVEEGGRFRAPLSLGPGKWMLRVEAHGLDGTLFRQRLELYVKG